MPPTPRNKSFRNRIGRRKVGKSSSSSSSSSTTTTTESGKTDGGISGVGRALNRSVGMMVMAEDSIEFDAIAYVGSLIQEQEKNNNDNPKSPLEVSIKLYYGTTLCGLGHAPLLPILSRR